MFKGIKKVVNKAFRVPNQGYGKVAPTGAPSKPTPGMGKGLAGLSSAQLSDLMNKSANATKASIGRIRMKAGGLAAGHKTADGVAHKGKTKGTKVVMAGAKGMKKSGTVK